MRTIPTPKSRTQQRRCTSPHPGRAAPRPAAAAWPGQALGPGPKQPETPPDPELQRTGTVLQRLCKSQDRDLPRQELVRKARAGTKGNLACKITPLMPVVCRAQFRRGPPAGGKMGGARWALDAGQDGGSAARPSCERPTRRRDSDAAAPVLAHRTRKMHGPGVGAAAAASAAAAAAAGRPDSLGCSVGRDTQGPIQLDRLRRRQRCRPTAECYKTPPRPSGGLPATP